MTLMTICGTVADALGQMLWRGQRGAVMDIHCVPSTAYGPQQAAVPIHIGHGGPSLGDLSYLERGRDDRLHAIALVDFERANGADIDAQPPGGAWYWSPTVAAWGSDLSARDATLLELSLTTQPATVAAQPVTLTVGDVSRMDPGPLSLLMRRAREAIRHRHAGDPLTIHHEQPTPSTATYQAGHAWLGDEVIPLANRWTPRAWTAELPAANLSANRATRSIWVHGMDRNYKRSPRLTYHGSPVAAHDPVRDITGALGFRVSRTALADEALEYTADGILDVGTPRRYVDGSWLAIELTAA